MNNVFIEANCALNCISNIEVVLLPKTKGYLHATNSLFTLPCYKSTDVCVFLNVHGKYLLVCIVLHNIIFFRTGTVTVDKFSGEG